MFEVITREELLKIIRDTLDEMYSSHRSRSWKSCIEKAAIAERLIKLIEVADCGSHGGYDPEDPNCGRHNFGLDGLSSRYNWLTKKPKK